MDVPGVNGGRYLVPRNGDWLDSDDVLAERVDGLAGRGGLLANFRDRRAHRQAQAQARHLVAKGQLIALRDRIQNQLLINREINNATLGQIRLSLQETAYKARADSMAARAAKVSEVLMAMAESIDDHLTRLKRVGDSEVRSRMHHALLAMLDNLIEQLRQ